MMRSSFVCIPLFLLAALFAALACAQTDTTPLAAYRVTFDAAFDLKADPDIAGNRMLHILRRRTSGSAVERPIAFCNDTNTTEAHLTLFASRLCTKLGFPSSGFMGAAVDTTSLVAAAFVGEDIFVSPACSESSMLRFFSGCAAYRRDPAVYGECAKARQVVCSGANSHFATRNFFLDAYTNAVTVRMTSNNVAGSVGGDIDAATATAICRMAGYPGAASVIPYQGTQVSQRTAALARPLFLANLKCPSTARSIGDCRKNLTYAFAAAASSGDALPLFLKCEVAASYTPALLRLAPDGTLESRSVLPYRCIQRWVSYTCAGTALAFELDVDKRAMAAKNLCRIAGYDVAAIDRDPTASAQLSVVQSSNSASDVTIHNCTATPDAWLLNNCSAATTTGAITRARPYDADATSDAFTVIAASSFGSTYRCASLRYIQLVCGRNSTSYLGEPQFLAAKSPVLAALNESSGDSSLVAGGVTSCFYDTSLPPPPPDPLVIFIAVFVPCATVACIAACCSFCCAQYEDKCCCAAEGGYARDDRCCDNGCDDGCRILCGEVVCPDDDPELGDMGCCNVADACTCEVWCENYCNRGVWMCCGIDCDCENAPPRQRQTLRERRRAAAGLPPVAPLPPAAPAPAAMGAGDDAAALPLGDVNANRREVAIFGNEVGGAAAAAAAAAVAADGGGGGIESEDVEMALRPAADQGGFCLEQEAREAVVAALNDKALDSGSSPGPAALAGAAAVRSVDVPWSLVRWWTRDFACELTQERELGRARELLGERVRCWLGYETAGAKMQLLVVMQGRTRELAADRARRLPAFAYAMPVREQQRDNAADNEDDDQEGNPLSTIHSNRSEPFAEHAAPPAAASTTATTLAVAATDHTSPDCAVVVRFSDWAKLCLVKPANVAAAAQRLNPAVLNDDRDDEDADAPSGPASRNSSRLATHASDDHNNNNNNNKDEDDDGAVAAAAAACVDSSNTVAR